MKPGEFTIQLAKKSDEQNWNSYLLRKKINIPLNYFSWSKIISSNFWFQKPVFLIVKDKEGKVRGLLCSFLVFSIKGKRKLYSSRFGMVVDNQQIAKLLFNYIKKFCKQKKVDDLLITSGFNKYDSKLNCFEKITMTLELKKDVDWLWNDLSPKTRNTIRRGYKNNYDFSSNLKYLNEFYNVYKKRMKQKGLGLLPLKFFNSIFHQNASSSRLFVALKNNKVIAGLILIYSKNGAQYTYAADDNSFYKNNMHCLLWEVINFLYKKKIKLFDMSESTKNGGVYFFKKFFGCEEKKIFYYTNKKNTLHASQSLKKKNSFFSSFYLHIKKKFTIHFSRII